MTLPRWTRPLRVVAVAGAVSYYFFAPDKPRGARTEDALPLSPRHFTSTTVVKSEPADPAGNTRLITLAVPPDLIPKNESAPKTIWSVFIKDDDIQVERPYTPLEGIDENGQMKFWVKRYKNGEVARWLHSKRQGDQIELRGPLQTFHWDEEKAWDDVVMISGGTGITPFYQLFHEYVRRNPTSKTRFTLLHASRTPSELPPPSILRPMLEHPNQNMTVRLFVSSLDSQTPPFGVTTIGHIDRKAVQDSLGMTTTWKQFLTGQSPQKPDRRIMFLVCGPESMISAIAGPYGRNYSQGPVAGILGELGFTSSEVRKL
ncbi:ferredoxin reductase-like protein [Cylindrobasidium torrendii FP15055 ss-10]|uniref:Ferredoxin reductase-like protein n=1 Tax=Cylindrobasidium torrendii FP15055 ss-10 TaxID=1314674 RepID=A0A0D7B5D6_9AGAR|nr:ferredoxin reductase-like protein [Cylindrobasidium torrendii FP15055 ss-10]